MKHYHVRIPNLHFFAEDMRGLSLPLAILAFITIAFCLPQWPHHQKREDIKSPRAYDVYETTTRYGHYTYAGYGPLPTVSSTLPPASSTFQDSGTSPSKSCEYTLPSYPVFWSKYLT